MTRHLPWYELARRGELPPRITGGVPITDSRQPVLSVRPGMRPKALGAALIALAVVFTVGFGIAVGWAFLASPGGP